MSEHTSTDEWAHDFLKEVVTQVRNEFYKTSTNTDCDSLIEEMLNSGENENETKTDES